MDTTSEETPTVRLSLLGEGSVEIGDVERRLTCLTVPEPKALARVFKIHDWKKKAGIVSKLLELGKVGKLAHITSETGRDVSTINLNEKEPSLYFVIRRMASARK